jgi:hypothetical protein
MNKLLTLITSWLQSLLVSDLPADPLASLSPRDWADLPVHHPLVDPSPCN